MANIKQSQPEHDNDSGDQSEARGIRIGRFTLTPSSAPGKIWMAGPSGEDTEVDEKVLEDLLSSVF